MNSDTIEISMSEFETMITSAMHKPIASTGKPYFLGGEALIQFSSGMEGEEPSVFWLVDQSNHTIRPFESDEALAAAFGSGVEEAKKRCVHVAHPTISSSGEIMDGVLKGYELLGSEHAVHSDGTAKPVDVSLYHLKKRYGKPINPASEEKAVTMLDNLLQSLSAGQDGVSSAAIEKIKRNERFLAHLVNALSYGGYSVQDCKKEIIRKAKQQ